MHALKYLRPATLADALAALRSNPDAKALAGGMTLIPTLKQRLAEPSHLVDLARLPELRGISYKGGRLAIGAATRHAEVAGSSIVRGSIPALAQLAGLIGDPQVRNRGTFGGSVANNDPAADCPAAVLALNGTLVTDRREIAADDFFQGVFATALEPDEILVRLEFTAPQRAAYSKFAQPASGYALAGVFVAVGAGGTRVAVTGAGNGVFRWREAEAALDQRLVPEALADAALDSSEFSGDLHATPEYRAQLVRVMAQRAVASLAER
jgi:carbon-monoxide dehydrogenase medium subunit